MEINNLSNNLSNNLHNITEQQLLSILNSMRIDKSYNNLNEFTCIFKKIITGTCPDKFTYNLHYYKTHFHNELDSIPNEIKPFNRYNEIIMKYYNCLLNIFLKVENYYLGNNKYNGFESSNGSSIEIEFRIGTIENNKFNASISKSNFEKILNGVLENKQFIREHAKVSYSTYIDTFANIKNNKKSYRTTLDLNTNKINKVIHKEKIDTYDCECKGFPFDLRLSLSNEKEFKEDILQNNGLIEFTNSRKKERISISFSEGYTFDFTIVNSYLETIPIVTYEVELELDYKIIREKSGITENQNASQLKIMALKSFLVILELFEFFE